MFHNNHVKLYVMVFGSVVLLYILSFQGQQKAPENLRQDHQVSSATGCPKHERVTKFNLIDKRPLSELTILQPDPSLALFDGVLTEDEKKLKFTAQMGEDRWALSTFFRNFRNGFYVELGAIDGLKYSNSHVFQEQFGWRGVLIEPSEHFQKLRVNPRCLNGGAICLNLAICDSWRTADFVTGGASEAGGLQETMTRYHERNSFGKSKKIVQVPCGPMGDVLKLAGVKRIDFFTIDVEGAEIYIVDTMDWENIPVHVVIIERHKQDENTERMDRILLQSGFKYYGKIGINVIWVNPKNARPADSNDSFK